jgi:uncharacterized protein (DUF1330 family)
MTVYAIAQISIHDRARYDKYVSGFMPVLQRYGGKLLVADEQPQVLQGKWDRDKIIIMAFPDRASYGESSEEYREISKDRIAATEGVVLLANGVGRDA